MPITPELQLRMEELLAIEDRAKKRILYLVDLLKNPLPMEESINLQYSLQELVNIYGFNKYKKLRNEYNV